MQVSKKVPKNMSAFNLWQNYGLILQNMGAYKYEKSNLDNVFIIYLFIIWYSIVILIIFFFIPYCSKPISSEKPIQDDIINYVDITLDGIVLGIAPNGDRVQFWDVLARYTKTNSKKIEL